MGHIDYTLNTTFAELLVSQAKYRKGVEDGHLVPLWWANNTQPYFAYRFAYDNHNPGATGVVMTSEELEDVFIAEQRAFNARLN